MAEFIGGVVRGAPIAVEETGTTVGARRGCKVGDFVLRYTGEHVFAGAAVAVEAKHDNSHTEQRALDELDVARVNRGAQAGLFIMAASHAPVVPRFKRCGQNVLVRWDENAPRTIHGSRSASPSRCSLYRAPSLSVAKAISPRFATSRNESRPS